MTTAEQIRQTIQDITNLESAKKHFTVLSESLNGMRIELSEKTLQLSKEQDDIEKLEQLSVTALFHKVLGNKEEQLEKERQEYLELAMKLKELKQTIEISEFELNIVKEKALSSDKLVSQLEGLKTKRESEILQSNDASKATLLNVIKNMDNLHQFFDELTEAYNAGDKALQGAENTLAHLQEAIKYGEWDMLGQNQAGWGKQSAMDNALRSTYQTQQFLQVYNKELNDIGISDEMLNMRIESISNFTDMFFDNLISDWIIQKKIKSSFNHALSVRDKIALIQMNIKNSIEDTRGKIAELEKVKDKVVMEG